jgi:hypothetical protein
MDADGLFKPPPDAVAHNSVADLLGDGVADARRKVVAAVENFNEKKPSAAFLAAAHSQEVRAFQKPPGSFPLWLAGRGQRSRLSFRR